MATTGTATSRLPWARSGRTVALITHRSNVSNLNFYNWPTCPASPSVHTLSSADVRLRERPTRRFFFASLAQFQVTISTGLQVFGHELCLARRNSGSVDVKKKVDHNGIRPRQQLARDRIISGMANSQMVTCANVDRRQFRQQSRCKRDLGNTTFFRLPHVRVACPNRPRSGNISTRRCARPLVHVSVLDL